ncbi:MAG TPA: calcium-binding protein, partial [Azospirillaceae bacterium]|nr:calcium-binding protein [Azospirillaceae bacterium]
MPVPTVTSIVTSGTPAANATTVDFVVTFSEAVNGVDAADFLVTVVTGSVTAEIQNVAGSGGQYTVTVGGITGTGDIRLDLNAGGTGITAAGDGTAIAGGFTGGATHAAATDLVVPTEGNDVLAGTAGDDSISGLGGDDTISGNGGNDALQGGLGADMLFGGLGADMIVGGDGDDSLNGGDENDYLEGGLGADTLAGGDGDDFFQGGPGNNSVTTGAGADTISVHHEGHQVIADFASGTDKISLGGLGFINTSPLVQTEVAGNLEITAAGFPGFRVTVLNRTTPLPDSDFLPVVPDGQPNFVGGGNAADNLFGMGGNDTIHGREGDDFLRGNDGDDLLEGQGGNDYLFAGKDETGNDTLDGGIGNDTVQYGFQGASSGVTFAVAPRDGNGNGTQPDGSSGVDTLVSIESVHLFGSAHADTLTGDDRFNYISGGAGNDSLAGGGSGDSFAYATNEAAGTDRIVDFAIGDNLSFSAPNGDPAFALTGPIQSGDDPGALAVGEVMVGTPGDVGGVTVTKVYANLGGTAGTVTIELAGSFAASEFSIF